MFNNPAINDVLFGPSWPAVVAWLVIGVVLLVIARELPKRLRNTGRTLGGLLIVIGLAHATIGVAYETDVETVERLTTEFLEAAEPTLAPNAAPGQANLPTVPADAEAIKAYLSPGLSFANEQGTILVNRPGFRDAIAAAIVPLRVEHTRIAGLESQRQGEGVPARAIAAWLDLRTRFGAGKPGVPNGPYTSKWRLTWEPTPAASGDGSLPAWQITQIAWLEFQGSPPPQSWVP